MVEVSTIGLDIAKAVFQVHGVDGAGAVVIRKRISRSKMLEFFAELPPCLIGIEACPSAHHWGRELQQLGHTVKLMPPSYVKAYLKRSKNDANDAAAICEAVTRPSMRFVPIKTKEQQTALMLHRTRQLLVRQRTMLSNALRGHLAELGIVSAKGRIGMGELLRIIADGADNRVPPAVRSILDVLARQYSAIGSEIGSIDKSILALHRSCEASRRLAEIPGIGPIVATALVAEIGDWVGAEAAHDRRQGQARQHHQAGQSILAMVASRRRHGRHPLRAQARHAEAAVARTINGAPTDKGGGRCTRQQNCTHGLGYHGPRREIQRAEAADGSLTEASS
jgi:transposase